MFSIPPIKRHSQTDWIRKQNLSFCCIQENTPYHQGETSLQINGWERVVQANGLKKQAGVAILIPEKIAFKPNVIRRDRAGLYILIKGKEYIVMEK